MWVLWPDVKWLKSFERRREKKKKQEKTNISFDVEMLWCSSNPPEFAACYLTSQMSAQIKPEDSHHSTLRDTSASALK